MINGRVSPEGALFALDEAAPPGTTCMGGQALTPAGVAYVANNILATPPYYFPNGFKTDVNGTLIIGPGPIIGYKGGYPYNADNELVAQLNQPVLPGDSYVGGIRVGPLGGVYIIDTAPPPVGGYSDGFSNGFDVYGGTPPVEFSPADLFASGEQGAWYDPSDLSTMFQDRAGTTPVTADGQTVGKILDKSGNGNHATAPSDAARPLYKTSGGYSWLQFDGVNNALSTAAIDFTATDASSVFSGVLKTNNTAISSVADFGAAWANADSFGLAATYSAGIAEAGFRTRGSALSSNPSIALDVSVLAVLTGLGRISTDTAKVRVNSSEVSSSTDQGIGNYSNASITIGSSTGYYFLPGRIYSLIVRGALSTTQEITDTETWVNGKTGAY